MSCNTLNRIKQQVRNERCLLLVSTLAVDDGRFAWSADGLDVGDLENGTSLRLLF